ncbi:MAG: MarR family transcriptional regulator [Flavipsychrobacter sp.]|nr:MarR family transcriptional regulator [Flavipsychrobacter sp.]
MVNTEYDIVASFTREITRVNLAFKQHIQLKLRQNNIDLTFEMLSVLSCLWEQDGINQQEIANITVKDKASMTYLLDNLTKRELVYRQEDDTDRRNKKVYLTSKGKELRVQIQPWVTEMFGMVGNNLPADSVKSLTQTLEKIRENLR